MSRWPAGADGLQVGLVRRAGSPTRGAQARRCLPANMICDIHAMSMAPTAPEFMPSSGSARYPDWPEAGTRLLRILGRRGISHRHERRHKPSEAVHQDLMQRKFKAAGPDLLCFTDITEYRTRSGRVLCCAV